MNKHKNFGFTLVELVIVVVVLGILFAIVTVVWTNVIKSSNDKSRAGDVSSWMSNFQVYQSRYGGYPEMPTGNTPSGDVVRCLGKFTSFSSKCGQYTSSTAGRYLAASGSNTLIANVIKVTGNKYIDNSGNAVKDSLVGPIVRIYQTTSGSIKTITAQYINFFENGCPSSDYTDISSSLPSAISGVLNGISGVKVCARTDSFTI